MCFATQRFRGLFSVDETPAAGIEDLDVIELRMHVDLLADHMEVSPRPEPEALYIVQREQHQEVAREARLDESVRRGGIDSPSGFHGCSSKR